MRRSLEGWGPRRSAPDRKSGSESTAPSTAHYAVFCPTGYGCVCLCPDCMTHCGPGDREAARFCVTQGIAPEPRTVQAARVLLDQREAA